MTIQTTVLKHVQFLSNMVAWEGYVIVATIFGDLDDSDCSAPASACFEPTLLHLVLYT